MANVEDVWGLDCLCMSFPTLINLITDVLVVLNIYLGIITHWHLFILYHVRNY